MDGESVPPHVYDWDDAELIQIYDETSGKTQVKVEQLMANGEAATRSSKKSSKSHESKNKKWAVGDHCRAVYEADNELYEAEILDLYIDDGTCLVRFLGYGNEEVVSVNNLRSSKGNFAQEEQIKVATQNWELHDFCTAPYKKNGEFYEAKIIDLPDLISCSVRFIGYENVDIVKVSQLRSSKGHVARTRQMQMANQEQNEILNEDDACSTLSSHYSSVSGASSMQVPQDESPSHPSPVRRAMSQTESNEYVPSDSYEESEIHHRRSSSRQLRPPARVMSSPPHAPLMNRRGECEDNDSFSALLMSWYMAGYHTGFYKGRQSRSGHSCSCSHHDRAFRN